VSHRWVEGTDDLGLELEAASPGEVFTEAAAALAELVTGDDVGGEHSTRKVKLTAVTYAELLVLWLEELVFLIDTESLVPERCDGHARAARPRCGGDRPARHARAGRQGGHGAPAHVRAGGRHMASSRRARQRLGIR